jgi:hypothetical protein
MVAYDGPLCQVEKGGELEPKAGTIGIVALRHDGKRVTVEVRYGEVWSYDGKAQFLRRPVTIPYLNCGWATPYGAVLYIHFRPIVELTDLGHSKS